MSDIEDQKYGLEGIEQSQGFEPMPLASPVPSSADDLPTDSPADSSNWLQTDDERRHHLRPAPPEPEIREYRDVRTGEELPENLTISAEQAAHDVGRVREEERQAREAQSNRDLADALDQLNAKDQGQQPAQDQPQPTALDEPQPEQMDQEAAQAHHDAAWKQANEAIERMLQDPVVRERLEGEFNQVRAESDAKVAQAFTQVEQAKTAYLQHANALTGQLNALILSNFPELQSVAGDQQQLAGAVQLLKQTNPQRAQQLADFALRASTLTGQLEQQGQAHRQAQAAQQEQALTEYTNNEIKRYEHWTAREVGDMKAVRENLQPLLQKHYGIDANQLKAIHDGKVQVDGARLLRSAEFQAVMTDAIRYRLAQRGVTQARTAVVPNVQRPGANVEPRGDEGSYATLERSLRGKDLTAKSAADLLIAHRARR